MGYWDGCRVATIAPFGARTAEVEERLRQAPTAQEGRPATRWTLRRIRDTFDGLPTYSLSGVWRRWARPARFSPDPAYADKQAHLLNCLQAAARQPEPIVLVCIDEMGCFRWPQGGQTWMPSPPGPTPVLPCAHNNRQWRLIGARNALTGQVTDLDTYIVGRRQVGELYQRLDQAYLRAERIFIVQDNWAIHTHPDVVNILQSLPRLEIVSLPTYAHWLNPIEKLWRWLRQDVLRLHQWAADWPTLLAQVPAFLDQFALGSLGLLRYVGLLGDGKLATALRLP
jgi:hypothetical protein